MAVFIPSVLWYAQGRVVTDKRHHEYRKEVSEMPKKGTKKGGGKKKGMGY